MVMGAVEEGMRLILHIIRFRLKVSRLYLPNKGSLASFKPPLRFEPRTHRLRGWTADFPLQVPHRLEQCLG